MPPVSAPCQTVSEMVRCVSGVSGAGPSGDLGKLLVQLLRHGAGSPEAIFGEPVPLQ